MESEIDRLPPVVIAVIGGPQRIKARWIHAIRLELMHYPDVVIREARRIVDKRIAGEKWTPAQVFKTISNP